MSKINRSTGWGANKNEQNKPLPKLGSKKNEPNKSLHKIGGNCSTSWRANTIKGEAKSKQCYFSNERMASKAS